MCDRLRKLALVSGSLRRFAKAGAGFIPISRRPDAMNKAVGPRSENARCRHSRSRAEDDGSTHAKAWSPSSHRLTPRMSRGITWWSTAAPRHYRELQEDLA